MDCFKMYSLSDPKKEAINTWVAPNLNEAECRFAAMKRLPMDSFKQVFGVCSYDPYSKKKH